jgi:hypothetical protein
MKVNPRDYFRRFGQVSTRYPQRVAEVYSGDLDRAMADSDEVVAAMVAAWRRRENAADREDSS